MGGYQIDNMKKNELFFNMSRSRQIQFEFFYLISTLILGLLLLLLCIFNVLSLNTGIQENSLYSFIGGFLGGWCFDTKWFYRVTAKGKDDQKPWNWQAHKIYWRLFLPWISAISSMMFYFLILSDVIPMLSIPKKTVYLILGLSFLFGYLGDNIFSTMTNWFKKTYGSENHDPNV